MIHPCDGRTDRRTDGRAIAYSALSIYAIMLSRAKNQQFFQEQISISYTIMSKRWWVVESAAIPLWQRLTSLYCTVLEAGWALVTMLALTDDGKYRHGAESEYRYSIPTQLASYAHSSRQPLRRVVMSVETWTDPGDVTSSTLDHNGVQPLQFTQTFSVLIITNGYSWRVVLSSDNGVYKFRYVISTQGGPKSGIHLVFEFPTLSDAL